MWLQVVAMAGADTDKIASDPSWFPLRYDFRRDEIHFVWLPRENHRIFPFLTDEKIAAAATRRIVPRRALDGFDRSQAPLHLVLHSGLTGSTLLTRVLDRPGVSMTFSEPPILTDLMSLRLSGGSEAAFSKVAEDILDLLTRPFQVDEAVVLKVGAVANALGQFVLDVRPTSRALCLFAPLPIFLASLARKGIAGRIWGRRLFTTLSSARLTELGFSREDLEQQTDLQIGGLAWLALHREMQAVGGRFATQAGWLDSETLINDEKAGLSAVARHFELTGEADVLANSHEYSRHSKTGERYDPDQRRDELAQAISNHAEEIDLVVRWIEQVAQAQRIPLTMNRHLTQSNGDGTLLQFPSAG